MRWRIWMAAALLAAIVGGGLAARQTVSTHCRRVEDLLVQAGAGESAPLEQAIGLWEQGLPLLSSLLNHEVLEQVGSSLSRARGCLQAGDTAGCREQLDAALYLLDDIRQYDALSWKNLL